MSETSPELEPVARSRAGFFQWFAISLILITALSLIAVHLPERLKLLLVFAIVYGLIAGGGLTTLAVKMGLSVKRPILISLVCLIIFGQSLTLYLTHQRYKESMQRQFQADQTLLVLERMQRTGAPPEDSEARQQYDQVVQQIDKAKAERKAKEKQLLKISSYLQHRISSITSLGTPWPELFWFCELIGCCFAAIWASRQVAPLPSKTPDESSQQEG